MPLLEDDKTTLKALFKETVNDPTLAINQSIDQMKTDLTSMKTSMEDVTRRHDETLRQHEGKLQCIDISLLRSHIENRDLWLQLQTQWSRIYNDTLVVIAKRRPTDPNSPLPRPTVENLQAFFTASSPAIADSLEIEQRDIGGFVFQVTILGSIAEVHASALALLKMNRALQQTIEAFIQRDTSKEFQKASSAVSSVFKKLIKLPGMDGVKLYPDPKVHVVKDKKRWFLGPIQFIPREEKGIEALAQAVAVFLQNLPTPPVNSKNGFLYGEMVKISFQEKFPEVVGDGAALSHFDVESFRFF